MLITFTKNPKSSVRWLWSPALKVRHYPWDTRLKRIPWCTDRRAGYLGYCCLLLRAESVVMNLLLPCPVSDELSCGPNLQVKIAFTCFYYPKTLSEGSEEMQGGEQANLHGAVLMSLHSNILVNLLENWISHINTVLLSVFGSYMEYQHWRPHPYMCLTKSFDCHFPNTVSLNQPGSLVDVWQN